MSRIAILFVQDNPLDGRDLVEKFVNADCQVTLECDGIGAIRQVHKAPLDFDAVILDIQNSLWEVRYTASALRAIGYVGEIVTVKPCHIPNSCDECFKSGCNDCIPRDISPDELRCLLPCCKNPQKPANSAT